MSGKVTSITDYGFFVELEPGIEGLIHISEIDWRDSTIHPTKRVEIGQIVEVMVLNTDADQKRISLSMKRCTPNPWEVFASQYPKGSQLTGIIDLSWDVPGLLIQLTG